MFGSHLSIAGGMHNALLQAETYGMETVQVFTKNQQQWAARPLDPAVIGEFRSHAERLGFGHIVAHDSYLINLAAQDEALWEKSVAAFAHEMERCDQLAIPYLVTHPGAHVGSGEACGIERVVQGMLRILRAQSHKAGVTVCLETTAGQGTCLGCSFEQLAAMLQAIDAADGGAHAHRVAVCVDTCHILAAGYDITTAEGTTRVLEELDRVIGLPRVKVWHLNDSKKPLGSRVDRHEHIGRGAVGTAAFGVICHDPRTSGVPKIMETPKDKAPDGREWDQLNLELLRAFAHGHPMKIHEFDPPSSRKKAAAGKPAKRKKLSRAASSRSTPRAKPTKPR
jgi:deoxyribonuclease-4